MELDQFIKNFASQFDETDVSEFKPGTAFKKLDEWSSLTALCLIGMVDDEYSTKITGEDIKTADTIVDLYNLISQKNAL